MSEQNRNTLTSTLSRTSPVLICIFGFANCILNPSYESFYLFIVLLALSPANWIIKHMFVKPFYNFLNVKSLPILGIGERPTGATSCGFTLDNIIDTSYGMPSGHSQMIWTFGTYLICKAINNWINKQNGNDDKDNDKNDDKNDDNMITQITVFGYMCIILVCAIILLIMIFVSYSRVYIEGCHTIQQVFAGGILGVITGFIIYYFENDALKVLSKII